MVKIIGNLFAGKLGINNLAGPVGIFTTVEASVKSGFESVLSLIILLGINIGFINLIPFPAFDGGRILFLLIEKVRKKPLSIKIENTINAIGLILLLILMLVVTINDIGRLGG
jgi:regulator of sigma E protease